MHFILSFWTSRQRENRMWTLWLIICCICINICFNLILVLNFYLNWLVAMLINFLIFIIVILTNMVLINIVTNHLLNICRFQTWFTIFIPFKAFISINRLHPNNPIFCFFIQLWESSYLLILRMLLRWGVKSVVSKGCEHTIWSRLVLSGMNNFKT